MEIFSLDVAVSRATELNHLGVGMRMTHPDLGKNTWIARRPIKGTSLWWSTGGRVLMHEIEALEEGWHEFTTEPNRTYFHSGLTAMDMIRKGASAMRHFGTYVWRSIHGNEIWMCYNDYVKTEADKELFVLTIEHIESPHWEHLRQDELPKVIADKKLETK